MALIASSNLSAANEIRRVEYRNPVAGFALTLPEDWEVATGVAGNVEMAIDAPSGVSLAAQPALEFFYWPGEPEPGARALGALLQAAVSATPPRVVATGKTNEWELTTTLNVALLGPVQTRWLFRKERGVTYVIGAMVRPQFAAQFKGDIDAAFSSCRLIDRPILRIFLEPTEHAYRLVLPYGWSWVAAEGRIIRTINDPGFFTWKVQRQDGLAGCFVSPAATLPGNVPYVSAEAAGGGLVLQELRKAIPDLRVEAVVPLTRAAVYYLQVIKAVMPSLNPRLDKVRADYLGHIKGKAVRLRITILTLQPDQSPLYGGPGPWHLFVSGIWAPVDEFGVAATFAAAVQSSFRLDAAWKKRTQEAVTQVLTKRASVFDKANENWDRYIRGTRMVIDPSTGKEREIPDGPGEAYLDPSGEVQFVGPGQTASSDWKEMKPVR
jgi:hypothetical protein